jgi:AcrR family transcriptional regulator
MNMSKGTRATRPYRMTRRAAASAETGERILQAAWRQFSKQSFEQVRLGDIADGASVSVQTLHTRFGSKDQLFVAAYRRWLALEVDQRRKARVGDVAHAVGVVFEQYEREGRAVLLLLSAEDRILAVGEMTNAGRRMHREWVAETFAPQLTVFTGAVRDRRLLALIAATDVLTWKLLRLDMRIGRPEAERVVVEMIEPPSAAR